jgi:MarR family transcriptional regulator, organic hydroperoxide resistance regulator
MTSERGMPLPGPAAGQPVSWAIFALARAHRALATELLAEHGLFPGQELTLFHLWENDGIPQKELVDALRLDHSTIAKSVRRLEEAGLVRREKSSEDGRVSLVSLTPAGRALRAPIEAVWQELEDRTTARLSADQGAAFVSLADAVLAGIDAEVGEA